MVGPQQQGPGRARSGVAGAARDLIRQPPDAVRLVAMTQANSMPTKELIHRSADLLRRSAELANITKGRKTGIWAAPWREIDKDVAEFRVDVAEHHRQAKIKLAALNERLRVHREARQARQAAARSN